MRIRTCPCSLAAAFSATIVRIPVAAPAPRYNRSIVMKSSECEHALETEDTFSFGRTTNLRKMHYINLRRAM